MIRISLFSLLTAISNLAFAADAPAFTPDCWSEPRQYHETRTSDTWKQNIKITTAKMSIPKPGQLSPNKGYFFIKDDGRPTGKITIFAEKDHLVLVQFTQLFGLSDVRWVNEKLLFMRPWWGRIAATDIIYDVEQEKVIYAEDLIDGTMAYDQARETCPQTGCECIKKR
jgi:hypothetical protein